MKLTIPKIVTYTFLFALLAIGLFKLVAYLSVPTDNEKFNQECRTCGIEDDLREQLKSAGSDKFILVVVGDGVKDKSPSKARPYSSNYAQGWDLYEGIAFAMKQKPFNAISKYVDVVFVDDGGDNNCAELISKEIIKYPRVIGVIGHASSSTTKVALENYRKANIPVLIPIATNPSLTINSKNCFRLPSNDAVQAKAICDFAINELKGENIYLVWDESESAKDYSDFLQAEISNLIGGKIKFRQPITFRPMNYEYLLKSIPYNNTDVLIFCGYGSMAREFFNGLRFEYLGKENQLKMPKVIMSDGCKISDIKDISKFGFDAYLSFPSEKLGGKTQFKEFKPEIPPKGQEKMMYEESYEIYGYDALTLFSLAFHKCLVDDDISRKTMNKILSKRLDGDELCYKYEFEKGENINSRYFIYSVNADTIVKSDDKSHLANLFTDEK